MLFGLLVAAQAVSCAELVSPPLSHSAALEAVSQASAMLQSHSDEPDRTALECLIQAAHDLAETDVERAAAVQQRMMLVMRSDDWSALEAVVDEGFALTTDGSPEAERLRQQFYVGLSFIRQGEGDSAGARAASEQALMSSARAHPDSWQTIGESVLHRQTGLNCRPPAPARLVSLETVFPNWASCQLRMDDNTVFRIEAFIPDPPNANAAADMLRDRVEGEPVEAPVEIRVWGLPTIRARYDHPIHDAHQTVWHGRIGDAAFIFIAEPEHEPDDQAAAAIHRTLSALTESLIAGHEPAGPDAELSARALDAAQTRLSEARQFHNEPGLLHLAAQLARIAEASAPDILQQAQALRVALSVALSGEDWAAVEAITARMDALHGLDRLANYTVQRDAIDARLQRARALGDEPEARRQQAAAIRNRAETHIAIWQPLADRHYRHRETGLECRDQPGLDLVGLYDTPSCAYERAGTAVQASLEVRAPQGDWLGQAASGFDRYRSPGDGSQIETGEREGRPYAVITGRDARNRDHVVLLGDTSMALRLFTPDGADRADETALLAAFDRQVRHVAEHQTACAAALSPGRDASLDPAGAAAVSAAELQAAFADLFAFTTRECPAAYEPELGTRPFAEIDADGRFVRWSAFGTDWTDTGNTLTATRLGDRFVLARYASGVIDVFGTFDHQPDLASFHQALVTVDFENAEPQASFAITAPVSEHYGFGMR